MKKHVMIIAPLAVGLAAMAQFTINWSTIDGGGGVASGGDYAMRGTMGQFDVGNMDGGDYMIYGGFWVPRAIQTIGAPWLTILSEGGTNVLVSWASSGWVLQQTHNLQSNWVDSASGSTNSVSIPATEAAIFYRLRQE